VTTPIAAEVARRRVVTPPTGLVWGSEDLREALLEQLVETTRIVWPSTRYAQDPVRFFQDILGVEPWSRQRELIEAVRDYPRVACRSGHRVSKSNTAAGLALWWYAAHEDARCVMTSRTSRQVDEILWRELRMMKARSGRCVKCKRDDPDGPRPCIHSAEIDGECGDLARTGLHSDDFREVVGFTAREADAVTGIAGRRLLFIVDEGASVPQEIYDGIEGNRAGGAKMLILGNPTQNDGEFFEAHEGKKKRFYHCITISSEESPNVVEGRNVVEGLATREWVEEKKEEWGEESALYIVRVKGRHATREDGKIFPIAMIAEAELRWHETDAEGRLFIGLDPASVAEGGDESAFSVRRGLRQIALTTFRGLSPEAHWVHLLSMVREYGHRRETPVVVLDREGKVGSEVYGHFLAMLAITTPAPFELVAVRASDAAPRQSMVYDRFRDELTANFESWLRDGGAIVEDAKLAKEMHQFEWVPFRGGRVKVTDKLTIKKKLGRSPDRYDATVLSVWEPASTKDAQRVGSEEDEPARETQIDPYRGGIDPYGGR
jgi:hypothetical protein